METSWGRGLSWVRAWSELKVKLSENPKASGQWSKYSIQRRVIDSGSVWTVV